MKNIVASYILVFKTNIRFKKDIKSVEPLLDGHAAILKWNIDMQDSDRVLRLESQQNIAGEIINSIRQAGYHCEELAG